MGNEQRHGARRSGGAGRLSGVRSVHRIASPDAVTASALNHAARSVDAGGCIVYPTDTLYAIGCRAADGAGAARVRLAKGRDDGKPLPLIAGSLAQAASLSNALEAGPALQLARLFWPGPLTLVLPLTADLPFDVTAGRDTVAVRVPAAAFARALCERTGPLVSTSANRSGMPAPRSFADAAAAVGEYAEVLIDAGALFGEASTIVDMTAQPALVRSGAVAWRDVQRAL